MSAAPAPAPPVRSLRRSISALVFLYAVAFAVAVLTGIKCQGEAAWRKEAGQRSAPPERR